MQESVSEPSVAHLADLISTSNHETGLPTVPIAHDESGPVHDNTDPRSLAPFGDGPGDPDVASDHRGQIRQTAVLHVGCGAYGPEKLPAVFRTSAWKEIRLDIDPEVQPDIVASITDMRDIPDAAMDAVYSSHNVEHLYPHEVNVALREMCRVLKLTGFAFIRLPDLQEVARHVADGRLDDPLYLSPVGPISPLDIMFGHRPSLARGNLYMAHRTGFTAATLGAALISASFAAAMVQRDPAGFCLDAIGFRTRPTVAQIAHAQAQILPAPNRPAVLYASVG